MTTAFSLKTKKFPRSFFNKKLSRYARHMPSVNIEEREEEYILMMAAPGLHREEISVNIKENVISIASEKKNLNPSDKPCINKQSEYDFSVWERKFALPSDADAIMTNAFYVNGELLLHIPKHSSPQTAKMLKVMVY